MLSWIKSQSEFFAIIPIIVLTTILGTRTSLIIILIGIPYFTFISSGLFTSIKIFVITLCIILLSTFIKLDFDKKSLPYEVNSSSSKVTRDFFTGHNGMPYKKGESRLDVLLSGRLSLLKSIYMQFLNSDEKCNFIFFGLGLNNLYGDTDYPKLFGVHLKPHNFIVGVLGEVGIIAFFLHLLILLIPFYNFRLSKSRLKKVTYTQLFILEACILISFFYPDYIFNGISTCLIFWVVYAELIKSHNSIQAEKVLEKQLKIP